MSTTPGPSTKPALYFVTWWFDAAMIGGLSLVVLLALRLLPDQPSSAVGTASLALSFVVNYPHFSATVYRLYQSADNVRQFPVTALGLPWVMLAFAGAALAQPETIAPALVAFYLLWSPYHYSGQTIGITLIYARRSGISIGRWERAALQAFVYSTFIALVAHLAAQGGTVFYGMTIPALQLPRVAETAARALSWAGGLAFLGLLARGALANRRALPPIVLLPAAVQFFWMAPGTASIAVLAFIPLFHSLQYLLIAWAMQAGLRISAGGDRSWRRLRRETLRWGARNVLGGVLLFVVLPLVFSWVDAPFATVLGVMVAIVNIHHFFVDGVIWKLRRATTASPLTMNVAELVTPAGAT